MNRIAQGRASVKGNWRQTIQSLFRDGVVGAGAVVAVGELRVLGLEIEADFADGAGAVLGDIDDGKALVVAVALVVGARHLAGAAQHQDDVGILLDGA